MSIINTLPYTLTNGTLADASQVMANFNQIVNNVNSLTAGAAGVNLANTFLQLNSFQVGLQAGGSSQFGLDASGNLTTSSTVTINANILTLAGSLYTNTFNADGSITLVGPCTIIDPTAAENPVTWNWLLSNTPPTIPVTASGTNTYAATMSPPISALVNGAIYPVYFTNANTGNSTLNLNSLGAYSIYLPATTTNIIAGNIAAGWTGMMRWTGTAFELMNPAEISGSFTITLTGMTSTITGTVDYTISLGRQVTITVPTGIIGTSNATTMTGTGVPALLNPASSKTIANVVAGENASLLVPLTLALGVSGTWTFANNSSPPFTSSGLKGVNPCVFQYLLN